MLSHKDSLDHLAARLGYGVERLLEIVADAPRYYSPFHLVSIKKDGSKKTRHIDNPNKKYPLRDLQKAINKELLIPEIPQLDGSLVGGIKRSSMLRHVEPHIDKKTVVCMDLSNCFPNISYKRVVTTWRRLGYSGDLAKILAKATTFRGYLPQGAPTSSLLCNFSLSPIATGLRAEMEARSLTFTQYIDDLCFSGDDDEVVRSMINRVYKIVPKFEQRINRKKTEIMDAKHRQSLMGITVNKKTKVNGAFVRKVEARIKAAAEVAGGTIDSRTNISIGGQILYIKKFDPKSGAYLEKLFNDLVKNVYQGGSKAKGEMLEPCWDYRKDKSYRAKCQHLSN